MTIGCLIQLIILAVAYLATARSRSRWQSACASDVHWCSGYAQCSEYTSVLQVHISAPSTHQCSRCTSVLQVHTSAPGVHQCFRYISVLQVHNSTPGMHRYSRSASLLQMYTSATGCTSALQARTGTPGAYCLYEDFRVQKLFDGVTHDPFFTIRN